MNSVSSTRHAVCCLLMNSDGLVLAISRTKTTEDGTVVADLTQWGLPGGKVEDNENLEIAVVRETFEETGYVIAAPQSVYTAFVPGEKNFICTTFIANIVAQAPDAPRSIPFEGEVRWVPPLMLLAGPFHEYNLALLQHLNLYTRNML